MKLRFFGSHDCDSCKALRAKFDAAQITYEFIDAFADDTQAFCDKHDVEALPHIQFLSDDGGVISHYAGTSIADQADIYIAALKQ